MEPREFRWSDLRLLSADQWFGLFWGAFMVLPLVALVLMVAWEVVVRL